MIGILTVYNEVLKTTPFQYKESNRKRMSWSSRKQRFAYVFASMPFCSFQKSDFCLFRSPKVRKS